MSGTIDRLIINGPYDEPALHWTYERETRSFTQIEGRRPAGYVVATQGSKSFDDPGVFRPLPLVNRIRPRVKAWREAGYPGVTGTTLRLLQHWRDPELWEQRRFFFCQLEAIETLIWLTEAPAGDRQGAEVPGDGGPFPRLCAKMATGSGKTLVMAMAIAWQVLNRVANPQDPRFSKHVLVVAPGLTVKKRLAVLVPAGPGNYYDAFDMVPSALRERLRQGRVLVHNWHALNWETDEQMAKKRGVDKCGAKSDAAYVKEVLCHVERIVRGWRRVDRQAEAREDASRHAHRGLSIFRDEDGSVVLRGRLAPEVGALVVKALDAAREALYQRRRAADPAMQAPTPTQQRADALALLAETALHHELDPGAPGERYQVVVHVDAPALADADQDGQSVLDDGTRVSAGTSQRLACDASRVVMRHEPDGRVVEIGPRTRTIPPALRRALQHRDQGCRFPGCGARRTEGHHVRHWARGGPTVLSNLALLCRFHHRAVHEEGYGMDSDADGALRFRRPDGQPLPEVPPPTPMSEDPSVALQAHNESAGAQVTARTSTPLWLGEHLDVGWAIDVLHPLAAAGDAHREFRALQPADHGRGAAGRTPGHIGPSWVRDPGGSNAPTLDENEERP